ncbi:MAG: hypothetical protein ACJ76X_09490 [Solirubrobacteraceae bacterium]
MAIKRLAAICIAVAAGMVSVVFVVFVTPAGAAVPGPLSALMTPSGGFNGRVSAGPAAAFSVGAAVADFTPPRHGQAPGGDRADCDHAGTFTGARQFAYEEPYTDAQHTGHFDPRDPFKDCNGNQRWDGNLLGGGSDTPRYFDHVADPVTARATVISNGKQKIAVEVVDQEGLFNIYQDRIRARVKADGVHLDGVFISATHDESAPDSLGLGGVAQTISGVNPYWTDYLVAQSAKAIEQAARRVKPARIRYTEILEPRNLRQCWSSYPFVDDQHIPVFEAVDRRGRAIVTLASVSQHAETLGFNGGTPALLAQRRWLSADWPHFFRAALEQKFGGVAIEMAGAVGSVESPEVYGQAISRTPQQFVDAGHFAGCRTLFRVGSATDTTGAGHAPLGYFGETKAFGQDLAHAIIAAVSARAYHYSASNTIWGARANICVPLGNALFALGAQLGVFGARPGYNATCTHANRVQANGSSAGQALRSAVAAFQIGDGEFISVPGEVFPYTYLRGFLGPQDMPTPGPALPPWLIPHMHASFRFINGLAEDMIGYMFPRGNAVGIPTSSNLDPSDRDRFGCGHSDDSEAVDASSADLAGARIARLLDAHGGRAETIVRGRYVLPGGVSSRDPLGGPELKCMGDVTFTAASHAASAVRLANGKLVKPSAWMSLSGLPQRSPDRDTRGYFDARGRRVWLDVFN